MPQHWLLSVDSWGSLSGWSVRGGCASSCHWDKFFTDDFGFPMLLSFHKSFILVWHLRLHYQGLRLLFVKNIGSYTFGVEYAVFTVPAFIAVYCFSIDIQYLKYVSQYVNMFWHLYATVRQFDMCICAQPFAVITCIGVCPPPQQENWN
jgi:hypothetical protein